MLAFIHGLPEHLPTMGVLNNHPQNIFSLAPIQVVWKSTNEYMNNKTLALYQIYRHCFM